MNAARNYLARNLTGAASAANASARPITSSTWRGGSSIADHVKGGVGVGQAGGKKGFLELMAASSSAVGGARGAWARGFHGDLGGAASQRFAASASVTASHRVNIGEASGVATFAEAPRGGRTQASPARGFRGIGAIDEIGGAGGICGIGGIGPRRSRPLFRSTVGWSAGQTRMASGGRGWFGFGGGKGGKGDDGGSGAGSQGGGPEFDAVQVPSSKATEAAAAAASNGAGDGGTSTVDAAVQGGGGVVAGTVSAVAVSEAVNPAPMASDPHFVGEVLNIAGESWVTTAGLMYVIEYFHLAHDMEWWSAIITTTVIIRILSLPLTIMQQRTAAGLHLAKPEIEALNQKAVSSQNDPDAMAAHQASVFKIWKKYDCNPVKMFVPLFVQAPLFISFYFAISRMSEGVPSFKEGGDFWFTDLSAADPMYVMPLLSAATFLLSIEFGGAAGAMGGSQVSKDTDTQQMYMKYAMRGLAVAMVPMTANFPTGVFVYWITTNIISFGQLMALKVPLVKRLAGIPEIPTGPKTAAANPSAMRSIEERYGASPRLHSVNPMQVGASHHTLRG